LIDELGGISAAIARARREAKIEGEPDPRRVILPGARGPLDQLKSFLHGESSFRLLRALVPLELRDLPAFGSLAQDGGIAYLPPVWLELR